MSKLKLTQNSASHKAWKIHPNGQTFPKKWSDDVSSQIICAQFIRDKLKRSKKVSISNEILQSKTHRHVIAIINRMSLELERLHPRTFLNISLAEPETAPEIIEEIGRSLLKHELSWGKIISFLTISAAFAVDCVRIGQPDLVQSIVESTYLVLTREAGTWIELEGGWESLIDHIRLPYSDHISFLSWLTLLVGFLLSVQWTFAVVKLIGRQILNVF